MLVGMSSAVFQAFFEARQTVVNFEILPISESNRALTDTSRLLMRLSSPLMRELIVETCSALIIVPSRTAKTGNPTAI